MTEQQRMDLPVNEQAAPAAAPAPVAEPAPAAPASSPVPPRRPPVRRVGTFTLGLALIVTGLVITAYFFLPDFNIIFAAKLAPLVLVFLGAEVLWASARRKGEERLRFDFLAAFVSFVLICASLCAATLPAMWRWFGPDRTATEMRLSAELEEQLHTAFQGENVVSCTGWVNLGGYEFDREMTLADLRAEDRVGVNIVLGGTVENGDEFAARVAALLPALRDAGADQAYFYWSDEDDSWDLDLDGVFDMNADAARLSQMGRHQVRVVDEYGDTLWMSEVDAEEYLVRAEENQVEPSVSGAVEEPTVSEETAAA